MSDRDPRAGIERPGNRIEIGGRLYNRDRLMGDLWLSKPEELAFALAMKKLGNTTLQRKEFIRGVVMMFAQNVNHGGEGIEWANVRRDIDNGEGGHLSILDFAADCLITSPGGIINGG